MPTQETFLDATQPMPGEYQVPYGARAEKCSSCGAKIVWGQTRAGRPIPLSVATLRNIGGMHYATTHYADCPDAAKWRRQ